MLALICGAGVGGLSAAIALKRAGYKVIIFEQSNDMRVTGFGLNLWPNATRSLYELGLKESFDRISVALDYYLCIDSNGKILHKKDVRNWKEVYGAPGTGVHRRKLTEMLAHHAGTENIRFGHKLIGYENDGTQVICHFSNGETVKGDLLIGADGIHSQVRQTMVGKIDYRPNTYRSYRWRGSFLLKDVEDVHPRAETEVFDRDTFFGTIPVGDGRAYWFASGPGLDDRESFNKCFQSWTKTHVPKTIAATPSDEIFQTQLMDLADQSVSWTDERVALLGDAAHPMMPDMAQGASQTFVDSQVLGQCMKGATRQTISQHLKQYENRRRENAEHVVNVSRTFVSLKRDETGFTIDPIAVRYERDIEGFQPSFS